jgi:type IV pilus assembly protein PilM
MANSVGLEIHSRGVRAVEATGRGKGARVLRFLQRPLAARGAMPEMEELRQAIADIWKAGRFSRNNVVVSVEAGESVVRELPIPFKSEDQIRKVIKYEAEHHLHDCDADDVVVQYVKVGESKEATNLLVFAARKDELQRRIDVARGAGIEPIAMDLDAAAFLGAVKAGGLLDETPDCVLLNVAHRSTEMVFVQGGQLRAVRSVRMGVDSIAQGLARDMDIAFEEAEGRMGAMAGGTAGDLFVPAGDDSGDRKETEKGHAELERDLLLQQRNELVARLRREYARTVAALPGSASPARAIATGPGLLVAGLIELLGEKLGIPVEPFRPSQIFSTKIRAEEAAAFDAGGAVALGLALKGLGTDPLGLDFRQENLKVANKFELLKGTLAVTVTLLLVALMASAFFFVFKRSSLRDDRYGPMETKAFQTFDEAVKYFNRVNPFGETQQINASEVATAGPDAESIQRYWRTLASMRARLRKIFGGGDKVPVIRSALQTWNEMFQVIQKLHKEIGYIDIEGLDVGQDGVQLRCVLPSLDAGNRIQEELLKLDAFQEMEPSPLSRAQIQGTEFFRVAIEFKEKKRR